MEVKTYGDCWTAEESVLIFIYTPVISIGFVSNPTTNRLILLPIIVLSPTVALSMQYSVLNRPGLQ